MKHRTDLGNEIGFLQPWSLHCSKFQSQLIQIQGALMDFIVIIITVDQSNLNIKEWRNGFFPSPKYHVVWNLVWSSESATLTNTLNKYNRLICSIIIYTLNTRERAFHILYTYSETLNRAYINLFY